MHQKWGEQEGVKGEKGEGVGKECMSDNGEGDREKADNAEINERQT